MPETVVTSPAQLPASADELAATRAALATATSELRAIQESAIRSATEASIATALSGFNLHPGAAPQLTELLRREVTCYKDADGSLKPMGPGILPIQEFVKERLAKPEYAHFLKGGASSSSPAYPGVPTLPPGGGGSIEPKTLGEAAIMQTIAARPQRGGDPRVDLSQPMGLRRASH